MPTETVYGLAADATNDRAAAAVFAAKGRPRFNPLIAHVLDIAGAQAQAIFDPQARVLAEAFWPGPLTLVMPVSSKTNISLLARAGLQSVALRAPSHPAARALIAAMGAPLIAPSANRSGGVSPTRADHVLADLGGRIDLILDGGASAFGLESTIVACLASAPRLLRDGAIPQEAIESVLGAPIARQDAAKQNKPIAPGLLASHYAPHAAVRLDAHAASPSEAALDFGGALAASPAIMRLDLSPRSDLVEAAANLFAHLRTLDATGAAAIAVAPIPAMALARRSTTDCAARRRRATAKREKRAQNQSPACKIALQVRLRRHARHRKSP